MNNRFEKDQRVKIAEHTEAARGGHYFGHVTKKYEEPKNLSAAPAEKHLVSVKSEHSGEHLKIHPHNLSIHDHAEALRHTPGAAHSIDPYHHPLAAKGGVNSRENVEARKEKFRAQDRTIAQLKKEYKSEK